MAYLVLAIGAVMVLIGAMAIVTGYPIIQVERGWATVIAGTSLLTGGIVTMALALVLQALASLRFAVAIPGAGRGSFDATTQPNHSIEPLFAPREELTKDVPYHSDAATEAPVLLAAAAAHPTNETQTIHVDEAAAVHHAEGPDLLAHHGSIHSEPIDDEQVQAGHLPADVSSSNEHAQMGTHEPPHLEDWLDRAFADLHEPEAPLHAEPLAANSDHPAVDHAVSSADQLVEHAPATQVHDDHLDGQADAYEMHHHEQTHDPYADALVHAEPMMTAPAATHPTSAVIGRYEADGTAYTMYADGSIDAQSDVGLYRFASMAELKAFIEG